MTIPTTDQQVWEAALIACGFKFGYECLVRDWYNPNHCGMCGYQFPVGFNPRETPHRVPAPALNDAGAVVAMLEWLICPLGQTSNPVQTYQVEIEPDANGYAVRLIDEDDVFAVEVTGGTLRLAIAAAVLAVRGGK